MIELAGAHLLPQPARISHRGGQITALEVIGAGLGRNATFSMKFALEKLGFGPCHHMSEVFANARRQIPLWLDVV